MPLQATSGAASYDAFGGGVAVEPVYIEQIFSTFLYTGNGTSQTITNGVDLLGKGGLVWIKSRMPFDASGGVTNHNLITNPAAGRLQSNTTAALGGFGGDGFTSTGFQVSGTVLNSSTSDGTPPNNYASWTFRKQKKFFDVVTYTGNGTSGRTVSHNLGSVPGCIIVKRTSGDPIDWLVYHRGVDATSPQNYDLKLNTTAARVLQSGSWNDTAPTSTVFTLGDSGTGNTNGETYVAYLFAHNAGGFGLTGTDNVISCGSFDANLGEVINLGYEPQWLLYKASSDVDNWRIADNMRGLTNLSGTNAYTIQQLRPNSSAVESENSGPVLTSTGFTWNQSGGGVTHIYIAIRRGPMKVPTSGTSVFSPIAASSGTQTTGFPVDMQILSYRSGSDAFLNHQVIDRLRGVSSTSTALGNYLNSSSTAAESNVDPYTSINMSNTGFDVGNNYAGASSVFHSFRRAPSFFDEVCYTGNGTNLAINHNLQAVPELIILKYRAGTSYGWKVTATGLTNPNTYYLDLNGTNAESNYTANFIYNRTSTTFTVVSDLAQSGWNWVAYLFATCAGVSKVGSYTGTATTLQVDCGFTGGSRFVLIKRVDDSADWYVWDSARGIVSGNDPYLLLNSTAAEVTNTDYVDTYSAGFEISSTAPAAINANGGTFIFLAIA